MEQKTNAFLENEKTGALMRKYAVPCVISLLVAALYNIVDHSARRWPQPRFRWFAKLSSAWGSPFCFPAFSGWTACFIPSPSPTR